MIAVIQRVLSASVTVDGDKKEIGLQEDAGKSNRRTWFCRVSLNGER
jgi:hypothetical protein